MTTKLSKLVAIAATGFVALGTLIAPITPVSAIQQSQTIINDGGSGSSTGTSTSTGTTVNICNRSDVPEEVKKANGCSADTDLATLIVNILTAVIGVSGLVAAVFIVVGGVGYITSTGDAGKVKKAKDTILYAAIGIVICALAFAIVNWVIRGALKQTPATGTGTSLIEVISEEKLLA